MNITSDILLRIAPKGKKAIVDDLAIYLAPTLCLDHYSINTPLRVAHFLAQAAHESDGFRTLREYYGPTAAQKGYEGRKDLGNTHVGDGKLFMGRGLFQLTGRANYAKYGKALGVDFVSNPELVATGKYSMLTACEYWMATHLNPLAEADDVVGITKRINGGTNGLAQREAYLKAAKACLNDIFAQPTPAQPPHDAAPKIDPTPAMVLFNKGDVNDGVKMIQIALSNKLKSNIDSDGDFGPQTEAAVKAFQKSLGLPPDGLITVDLYAKILA